jgi:hypothetical protein
MYYKKHIDKPNVLRSSLKISLSDYSALKLIDVLETGGIGEDNIEYIKDILGLKYKLYKDEDGTKFVVLEMKNGETRALGELHLQTNSCYTG